MKFGLSEELAKKIADSIMQIVPYNINVMNSYGIIIASGDEKRIGMLHQGALKAINKNGLLEVYEETMTDKIGVNLPFTHENEIVGVIGISGKPQEVRTLVYVVKVLAEMMIDQQYIINKDIRRKVSFENFLREWCETPREDYGDTLKKKAIDFNVNLEEKRVCVVLESDNQQTLLMDAISVYLKNGEYILKHKGSISLIMNSGNPFMDRLEKVRDQFEEVQNIGVGVSTSDVFRSMATAQRSLFFSKRMGDLDDKKKNIVYFDRYRVHDMVFCYQRTTAFENALIPLGKNDKNNEMLNTFLAYFDLEGDIAEITAYLHIHRNTLLYRIAKIEELTNRSFKNINDRFFLYSAYIMHKLHGGTGNF
ncbi:helix-turn-helix domain-containing protein [Lachnospiraceae bacterium ZAX-1]